MLLLGISWLSISNALPNIVFVLTDDVDVPFSGLKVRKYKYMYKCIIKL